MSDITINYPLECHIEHSKATVQALLEALEEKYAIKHEFIDEHACNLTGTGVKGQLQLLDDCIDIQAKLSFLMLPFKSVIEAEIISKLDEKFKNEHWKAKNKFYKHKKNRHQVGFFIF